MQYYLFSDFDGTLRNGPDRTIHPKDLEFVINLQKKDIKSLLQQDEIMVLFLNIYMM